MKNFLKKIATERNYNDYEAIATIKNPEGKPERIAIGKFKTLEESEAACKGFHEALNYVWGKGEIIE